MANKDKEQIFAQTTRLHRLLIIKNGFKKMKLSLAKITTALAFALTIIAIATYQIIQLSRAATFLDELSGFVAVLVSILILPLGFFLMLYIFGVPKGAYRINTMMRRISVKNNMGEVPMLVDIEQLEDSNVVVYEFVGYGIPLRYYEDNTSEIESALNANIVKIRQSSSKHRVFVYAVGYDHSLPQILPWKNELVPKKDFEILLGQSLLGDVIVDMNKIPHMLIGGSTGSGKSVLLKSLIYQCYVKDAEIYIADFKGGLDFNGKWRTIANVEIDIDQLIDRLESIVKELENRKRLFYEENAINICDYRSKSGKKCRRIVFACDEIAEILDKTGLDKNDKEKVAKVENLLSTIARQGRAFGINLILATQRPDATILSGQIRNNIDYRACGRADDVLSKIVLDNTDASEKIPKDEQGLFLDNMGEVFRAYYFNEEDIEIKWGGEHEH